MASTVQGSLGGSNAGAVVSAILLTGVGGRPNGLVTSDIAAASTGNFSIGGLAAGVYEIKAVINNSQLGNRQGTDLSNLLFVNTIQVDGSSTYKL